MQITCGMLIDGVQQTQLQDADKVTWSNVLLMSALNQSLSILALVRPDATPKRLVMSCVEGTFQQLPADGLRLLRVVRNRNGNNIGRSIRLVKMLDLDATDPNWHRQPPQQEAHEYMFDENQPKQFYVYPPVAAGVQLEVEYSAEVPTITSMDQPLPVDSIYMQPLQELMLYKLLSGSSGMNHLNTAMAMLDRKRNSDGFASPGLDRTTPVGSK